MLWHFNDLTGAIKISATVLSPRNIKIETWYKINAKKRNRKGFWDPLVYVIINKRFFGSLIWPVVNDTSEIQKQTKNEMIL